MSATSFFGGEFFGGEFFNSGSTPTPGRSGLGGDDVPRRNPNKGWDREEWKRRKAEPEQAIEKTLREAYAELTGETAPIHVLARVDAIVRPVAKPAKEADIPLRIDWSALAAQYERTNRLVKLWQEEMQMRAEMEEEDEIMLLLQ